MNLEYYQEANPTHKLYFNWYKYTDIKYSVYTITRWGNQRPLYSPEETQRRLKKNKNRMIRFKIEVGIFGWHLGLVFNLGPASDTK